MRDWNDFNDQFRETDEERNARLRQARLRKQSGTSSPSASGANTTGDPRGERAAFPTTLRISLRDYFAGQALAGILGGGFADTVPHDDISGGTQAAAFAYQYADAMLRARASQERE